MAEAWHGRFGEVMAWLSKAMIGTGMATLLVVMYGKCKVLLSPVESCEGMVA